MVLIQQDSASKKGSAWQNRSGNVQKNDFTTLVYGKIPPQAKEMEAAVLGACMIEKGTLDQLTDILHPECFYVAHKIVFEAMQQLSADNQPIDILTVVEQLKSSGELERAGGSPGIINKLYAYTITYPLVKSAKILMILLKTWH